ncbi:hypothetical protein DBV15_01136 [Temnothorax longispinosus]|uniref:Uncharacterized protein n=1 Tax=Temnothorax longispinosus TaxID=300112 RepID=A0A4S2J9D2_9HYME|nr:hypothetical protein DBV15_01136 [Temnothorax longispinosus]
MPRWPSREFANRIKLRVGTKKKGRKKDEKKREGQGEKKYGERERTLRFARIKVPAIFTYRQRHSAAGVTPAIRRCFPPTADPQKKGDPRVWDHAGTLFFLFNREDDVRDIKVAITEETMARESKFSRRRATLEKKKKKEKNQGGGTRVVPLSHVRCTSAPPLVSSARLLFSPPFAFLSFLPVAPQPPAAAGDGGGGGGGSCFTLFDFFKIYPYRFLAKSLSGRNLRAGVQEGAKNPGSLRPSSRVTGIPHTFPARSRLLLYLTDCFHPPLRFLFTLSNPRARRSSRPDPFRASGGGYDRSACRRRSARDFAKDLTTATEISEKDKNNDVNSGTLSEDAEKCLLHNDPRESRGSSRNMRLLGNEVYALCGKVVSASRIWQLGRDAETQDRSSFKWCNTLVHIIVSVLVSAQLYHLSGTPSGID